MRVFLLAAMLGLAGCAVATTGVVQRAEGFYTVTRQGAGAWVQTVELTALATQEAGAHCGKEGRRLKVVHTKEIPAGVLGRWPESEVLFRCDEDSTRGLGQQTGAPIPAAAVQAAPAKEAACFLGTDGKCKR